MKQGILELLNPFNFFSRNSRSYSIESLSERWLKKLSLEESCSYFLLSASFGDKWCILSFIPEFLCLQNNVKIIASKKDFDLVRIFLSEEMIDKSFVFLDGDTIIEIDHSINPLTAEVNQLWPCVDALDQTPGVMKFGFPVNSIRPLHIIKYPYFSDLHLVHGVSYGTLLKMLLYLPSSSMGLLPKHYSAEDLQFIEQISIARKQSKNKMFALFNVVNISHKSFSNEQILSILTILNRHGFDVYVNVTNSETREDIEQITAGLCFVKTLEIPGHLLALVSKQMDGVLGIIGGAMNVAVLFSPVHCLTFYAEPRGFKYSLREIFGGLYADNLWQMYNKEWPCVYPERILDIKDIKNPENLSLSIIENAVTDFCQKISNLKMVNNAI